MKNAVSNKRRSGKARIYCQKKQKRYPPDAVLVFPIGAWRSDAASGFPPGRGWLFSNRVRKERAAELRNTRAFPDEKHSLATAPVPEVPVARSKLAL